MGSNVVAVFLDEFLFMNPKAFPSIFPTTATGALLVMTSSMSPGGDSSALKLLDVKYEDGSSVINKHNWVQVFILFFLDTLYLLNETCKTCKAKGIPEKCTHISRPPQHFQNYASQSRLSKLLSGDANAYQREMMYFEETPFFYLFLNRNVQEEPMITPAFDDKWVDNMIMNARDIDEDVRQIFIAIDPAAGKTKNIYALCSSVFLRDGTCIVCLSKTITKHIRLCPYTDTILV